MRKACIDLNSTMKFVSLSAGDLGGGKCLYMVVVSSDIAKIPTPKQWKMALDLCMKKADELKYEVSRIRGIALCDE